VHLVPALRQLPTRSIIGPFIQLSNHPPLLPLLPPFTPVRHVATKYGVSTFQLALVNDASIDEQCENLMPNQTVCLGVSGQDCTKVYTVVANE
jgi:hypothetical protein